MYFNILMSYSRSITRQNPSCLLFLIDQSGSMANYFAGSDIRKHEAVAQIVNRLIDVIGLKCTKGTTVRHYFDIGVIVYSDEAISIFKEESSNPCFRPINLLYETPINLAQVEAGKEEPIWIIPKAKGSTAMFSAFSLANTLLNDWVNQNPHSYPPTLFHISDGDFTDSDPRTIAEEIKQIQTDDGKVLIFNINVAETKNKAIAFPDSTEELPGKYACNLFEMSSILPQVVREKFFSLTKENLSPQARAFVFNADPTLLIICLDIGTPANLLSE